MPIARFARLVPALCLGAFAAAAAANPNNYFLVVQPATSSATYTFGITAPFQVTPSGTSYMIGAYDPTTNPADTRTRPGWTFTNFTDNQPVPITGGGVNFSAGNTASPSHPSGGMTLMVNTAGLSCAIAGLNLNVLNGAPITFAPSATLSYGNFTERNPTALVPGISNLSVPLGDGSITSVLVAQVDAANTGTMTHAGGNTWNYSVTMNVRVETTADLSGTPVPIDPQVLPVTITGSITLSGATAVASASATISANQVQPGPTPLDPIPFTVPVLGGNLLVHITLGSVTITVSSSASLAVPGTRSSSADVATAGSGSAIPDHFITGEDFDLYVQAFFTEQRDIINRLIADVATAGTGDPNPDGFVTGEDFDLFVIAYFMG